MKFTNIKKIIASRGYSVDEWTFLDKFSKISYTSEGDTFLSKNTTQVYFDSTNELLYIRNYDEHRIRLVDDSYETKTGEVILEFDNNKYVSMMVPGYRTVDGIGYVSSIMDTDYILSINDDSLTGIYMYK